MITNIKNQFVKIRKIVWIVYPTAVILLLFLLSTIFILTKSIHSHFNISESMYLLILAFIFSSIIFIIFYIIRKRMAPTEKSVIQELDLFEDLTETTNEIIILLDNFGQIINYNKELTRILKREKDDYKGKPFRDIFGFEHLENRQKYENIILDKLKDVFRGHNAEIISPVWLENSNEYVSIHLKLIPKFKDDELDFIFAIGRFIKSDYITNEWLSQETSNYELHNDISFIHVFCHRLTRNLDGKLPRNEILFIQIALQEVIINAIEHGNLELDFNTKSILKRKGGNYWELVIDNCNKDLLEKRKVYIEYKLEPDKVTYIVKDEGSGFDWKKFIYEDDHTENIATELHGIGLQMVKSSFNEVIYNEIGNEVTLIKNFI